MYSLTTNILNWSHTCQDIQGKTKFRQLLTHTPYIIALISSFEHEEIPSKEVFEIHLFLLSHAAHNFRQEERAQGISLTWDATEC